MRQRLPDQPHLPPPLSDTEVLAIKSLAQGTANDGQQKIALNAIIYKLAATYDMSYRPEDTHATTFAEGRRFVGLRIVEAVNRPMIQKQEREE